MTVNPANFFREKKKSARPVAEMFLTFTCLADVCG